MPHRLRAVVLHLDLHVLLGVDDDLLASLVILEPDLVEVVRPAALGAARLDAALRLIARERVRRRLLGVIDPARDDRSVRVTLEEVHDYFLAHPRDLDEPPVLARPRRRHAHPAGAVLVLLPVAVPVEVHLHPPVLVRPDLLPRLPHHHRGLRAPDERLTTRARWMERHVVR